MTLDESYNNYLSHEWESTLVGAPDEWPDRVTYCVNCGIENLGNPREFESLEYPPCDRKDD